jgi:hypothetical protein
MTWRSVLAAVGLVSAPALLSAEPIDFHIVSRPEHWGGLELPGKPASNQQRRLHGAVVPHLQPMEGALEGFESYRVYFILNEEAHVQNVYARESRCLFIHRSVHPPPLPPASPVTTLFSPAARHDAHGSVWFCVRASAVFGDDYAAMTLRADEKGVGLFQVPIPFGADYGGVNQALYKVKASSEFDTWITVGADNGNPSNQIRCGVATSLPFLLLLLRALSRSRSALSARPLLRGSSLSGSADTCLLLVYTARLAWVRSTRFLMCRTVPCSR